MREIRLSWLSDENWDEAISQGFLPILAIKYPPRFFKTQIHFPELIHNEYQTTDLEEAKDLYWNDLQDLNKKRIIRKLSVLSHIANASSGIMIFTELQEDPYREVLGQFLGNELY